MTSTLAKLLRQSISNKEEFVTIEREVDYVRSLSGDTKNEIRRPTIL